MRIAANDPNLAHSLSRARLADPIAVGWKHIAQAKDGITFARRLAGALRGNGIMLSQSVSKDAALVVSISRVPGDLRLVLFKWQRRTGAAVFPCGVVFTPHCIARLFQRGTGEADIPAALEHVRQHLLMLVTKMPEAWSQHGPHSFEIATSTGCLCGEVQVREDGGFAGIVKTYITRPRPELDSDEVMYQPRVSDVQVAA